MTKPGQIAIDAAEDALENVGVHEQGGNNRGQYVETYLASVGLGPGAPWCAAFVYYRLKMAAAGLHLPWPQQDYPRSGYCPDIQNWAKSKGLWVPVSAAKQSSFIPQMGDLALFYFPAKGRVAHVGIVISPFDSGGQTVEGNTNDGTGVERDGDGVYKRTRTWQMLGPGGGFVRLPF